MAERRRIKSTRPRGILALIFILCSIHVPLSAMGALPASSLKTSLAISVHELSQDYRELDTIAAAGFKFVRLDMTWEAVERERGKYDWSRSLAKAQAIYARNMRPLFVLAYSNALYAPTVAIKTLSGAEQRRAAGPATPDQVTAYSRFAAAAAAKFTEYGPVWEVWNEPEHSSFWPPKADPEAYATLAADACRAIRAVDVNATVIGPGAAIAPNHQGPRPPFLVQILKSPASRCFDAISVHPYLAVRDLEEIDRDWAALRELIANEVHGPSPPAMVNSEWGLSTRQPGVSEEMQAWYSVRMMLLNIANRIPITVWYEWRDANDAANDAEGGFGLVHNDGEPKPSLRALQTMMHLLSETRFVCRSSRAGLDAEALIFSDEAAKNSWAVAWNSNPDRRPLEVQMDLPGDGFMLDMYGSKSRVVDVDGKENVLLGPKPVYFHLESGVQVSSLCGVRPKPPTLERVN
jgi:hypothetical protein